MSSAGTRAQAGLGPGPQHFLLLPHSPALYAGIGSWGLGATPLCPQLLPGVGPRGSDLPLHTPHMPGLGPGGSVPSLSCPPPHPKIGPQILVLPPPCPALLGVIYGSGNLVVGEWWNSHGVFCGLEDSTMCQIWPAGWGLSSPALNQVSSGLSLPCLLSSLWSD